MIDNKELGVTPFVSKLSRKDKSLSFNTNDPALHSADTGRQALNPTPGTASDMEVAMNMPVWMSKLE
jgi:hypothetical protein